MLTLGKLESNVAERAETINAASGVQPGDGQQSQMQLQIDDDQALVSYSTAARVWGSAEEINVDFAGPLRPSKQSNTTKLKIDTRVVLNPWAAKRLAIALAQAVTRYEQTYGTLEVDERKRRVNGSETVA